MKRITIILDGSADRASEQLGGKTPLEYAVTPILDRLASQSKQGCAKTIPDGLEVGSAVANMGLLGLDPHQYNGRSALEAAGCGIETKKGNMYIRCNLVHMEGDSYDTSVISDYSASELPTEEAVPYIEAIRPLFTDKYTLHHMESFRSSLEIEGGEVLYPLNLAAAHDIIGLPIKDQQPNPAAAELYELQRKAYDVLHKKGGYPNAIWFWGDSKAPELPLAEKGRCCFAETVLMKGLSNVAQIDNFPTDEHQPFCDFLRQKCEKALAAMKEYDRLYIHIQATDDLSHDKEPLKKANAISEIDRSFLGPFLDGIEEEYVMVILSDHFTFSDTGAHGADPVPFIFYNSTDKKNNPGARFTEASCARSGYVTTASGLVELMESFK